jgi:large subunit ribosomal protein L30
MNARSAPHGELKVTLLKSLHGQLANIAASVRGLGLRKRHQSVTVSDSPENRGMVKAAAHLLNVRKVEKGKS